MDEWKGDWVLSSEWTKRLCGAMLPRNTLNNKSGSLETQNQPTPSTIMDSDVLIQKEDLYRYQCTFCLDFFSTKNLWSCHEKQHHSIITPFPKSMRCGFCNRKFQSWSKRTEHIGHHFAQGKTMIQWDGDWGLSSTWMKRISDAINPQDRILRSHCTLEDIHMLMPTTTSDLERSRSMRQVFCGIDELQKLWDQKTSFEVCWYQLNLSLNKAINCLFSN
jgi:hypothetical protein